MKAKGQKSIKIGANEYKALRAIARQRGCFVSKLLTDAIRMFLNTPPEVKS